MILGTCSGLLYVALFSPKQAVMLSINWIIDVIRCRWTKKPFTHLQEGLFYNVALSVVIFICLGRPKVGENIKHIPPKWLSWNFPPKWLSWNIPPKRLSWMGMDGLNNVYIYISNLIHHPNLLTYLFPCVWPWMLHDITSGNNITSGNIDATKTKRLLFSSFSLCAKQVFQGFTLIHYPLIRDPSSWRGMCSNTSRHNTTWTSDS